MLQNIKEMEACLAVGKEVDKVSSKFTSLNKTIGKTIDEQIQLIGKKIEEYLFDRWPIQSFYVQKSNHTVAFFVGQIFFLFTFRPSYLTYYTDSIWLPLKTLVFDTQKLFTSSSLSTY